MTRENDRSITMPIVDPPYGMSEIDSARRCMPWTDEDWESWAHYIAGGRMLEDGTSGGHFCNVARLVEFVLIAKAEGAHEERVKWQRTEERRRVEQSWDDYAAETACVHPDDDGKRSSPVVDTERDEALDMLSALSSQLGVGMGDENTTLVQYVERIKWGIEHHNTTQRRIIDRLSRDITDRHRLSLRDSSRYESLYNAIDRAKISGLVAIDRLQEHTWINECDEEFKLVEGPDGWELVATGRNWPTMYQSLGRLHRR